MSQSISGNNQLPSIEIVPKSFSHYATLMYLKRKQARIKAKHLPRETN